MNRKITLPMIVEGLEKDVIKLDNEDPSVELGVIVRIGEFWFYAFGLEGDICSAKVYQENVPKDEIAREIFEVLDGEGGFETEFPDEYQYYYWTLREAGINGPTEDERETAARTLASKIDQFYYATDYYGYTDSIDDPEANVQTMTQDILSSKVEDLLSWLSELQSEYADLQRKTELLIQEVRSFTGKEED